MARIPGQRLVSGTKCHLYVDGNLWAEVKSYEAKTTINRETVQMAGSYDEDSKITSYSSEGSIVVNKVFGRESDFINAFKQGIDKRFQLFSVKDDPDAYGRESTRLTNCWLNEITVDQWEVGTILEREFPFGYTLEDVELPEIIPVQ